MNESQYTALTKFLIKNPERHQALIECLMGRQTAYTAEIQFNLNRNTLRKDILKIKKHEEMIAELNKLAGR